jgi:hypothetical protein
MADLHMPRAAGLALIAALLSPPPLQAQTLDAAKAFTTALYSAYATGSPDYVGANPERTFSPELLALIRKDQANTPAGEVGILDGDPICDCQDAEGLKLTDVKVVEAGKGAARADVVLAFPSETRSISLDLVAVGGEWRVGDVHTEQTPSLVKLLANPAP